MNFHEPQWLERAVTAGALYLGTLTAKLLKDDRLQRRLSRLEEKFDEHASTLAGAITGVYRRLGRLESHANITPNPFVGLGPEEPTNPGGKP